VITRSIDEILETARARLQRVTPREAYDESALLVDIRPAAQRAIEGEIPGALIVERNVLEWRFDPRSDARLPEAGRYDLRVIVLCSEGYTSSRAAAALQDLGLVNATDVIGGFRAWRALGLPTTNEAA
jgi:rhodanese-related sulfurtransferase